MKNHILKLTSGLSIKKMLIADKVRQSAFFTISDYSTTRLFTSQVALTELELVYLKAMTTDCPAYCERSAVDEMKVQSEPLGQAERFNAVQVAVATSPV